MDLNTRMMNRDTTIMMNSECFIYKDKFYCLICCLKIQKEIDWIPDNVNDFSSYGNDEYPHGPFVNGGGPADGPRHCRGCSAHLKNPLTELGQKAVENTVELYYKTGEGDKVKIEIWREFYLTKGEI